MSRCTAECVALGFVAFPYGIYYTIREDFIDVLAVYDGRWRLRRFDP